MKNLKQLHYCKERGALSNFNTETCKTCPYYQKSECAGINCDKNNLYNVKSNKNIWSSVFFIFIALSLYFIVNNLELQNYILNVIKTSGIDKNLLKFLRSSEVLIMFKASFTLILGMLSIKSFILLFQPEKVRL